MKTSITSFDLRLLVAEWQGLVGGHVDKIYQWDDEVMFRVNTSDRGKVELYSKAGRWLCLHTVEDKPESPPPFAQTLRRLLDNARVTSVEQRGLDRIAVFRVERGPERFDVVFEVFSKGNLVLVRDGTIVAVMSPQKFKDRAVQVGEPYAYPAAGIDPLELVQYGEAERKEFPTFNEALSHFLMIAEPQLEVRDDFAAKFERRIGQQRETLQKLRDEAILLEAQAVFLYGHYAILDELLRAIREGRPPPEQGQIKAIDRKAHTVTVAVGDFDAITLDYDKDVTSNAQAYYDRRKEAQLKAQRVEEAIAKTREEMDAAKAKAVKAAKN